mgnify:CR=1 FL=1
MIPFDFIYCRPDSLTEALDTYRQLEAEGKSPVYYSGGSEIITLCRAGGIRPGSILSAFRIACACSPMTRGLILARHVP